MLCQHAGNKLWIEPQMLSSVLTDSSHTCGSLDLLFISKQFAQGDMLYFAPLLGC